MSAPAPQSSVVEKEKSAASSAPQLTQYMYYDKTKQQRGPALGAEIKYLYDQGSVEDETFVWTTGMSDWKRLCDTPVRSFSAFSVISLTPLLGAGELYPWVCCRCWRCCGPKKKEEKKKKKSEDVDLCDWNSEGRHCG